MTHRVYFLAALLTGCTSFKEDAWDTGAEGSGTNGTNITEAEHGGLEDLTQNLDQSGCDTNQATDSEIAGAASYYYGLYQKQSNSYSGYEQWLIFANETWSSQGFSDCTIQWTASASDGVPENTAVATDGLDVVLTLDRGASTCPDDMLEDINDSETVHYDLRIASEQVDWYFSSGTQFGSGLTNQNTLNFITEKSCLWF
jgi:hypothetical protein